MVADLTHDIKCDVAKCLFDSETEIVEEARINVSQLKFISPLQPSGNSFCLNVY